MQRPQVARVAAVYPAVHGLAVDADGTREICGSEASGTAASERGQLCCARPAIVVKYRESR